MNKGYMCWVKGGGRPKKIHETLEIAEREADRLAAMKPTQNVYVVEIVSVIEAVIGSTFDNGIAITEAATFSVESWNTLPVKVKTSNTLSLPKKGVVK